MMISVTNATAENRTETRLAPNQRNKNKAAELFLLQLISITFFSVPSICQNCHNSSCAPEVDVFCKLPAPPSISQTSKKPSRVHGQLLSLRQAKAEIPGQAEEGTLEVNAQRLAHPSG